MGGKTERQNRPRPWACKLVVLEATERVRVVLVPELGPSAAAERANNIAQALLFDASQAEAVAHEMLRDVPESLRRSLAQRISVAWAGPEVGCA